MYKARFPFKRNRLRCVRCVNENRKTRVAFECMETGLKTNAQAYNKASIINTTLKCATEHNY